MKWLRRLRLRWKLWLLKRRVANAIAARTSSEHDLSRSYTEHPYPELYRAGNAISRGSIVGLADYIPRTRR